MAVQDTKVIYSYHTFLYPFLWDNKGSVSIEDFDKWFCPNKDDIDAAGWHPDDIVYKDENTGETLLRDAQELVHHRAELHEEYRAFQYFNEAARKALFRVDGNIVRNYALKFDKGSQKSKYIYRLSCYTRRNPVSEDKDIIDYDPSEDIIDYDLIINAIRLKAFNTGVAILIFELMYMIPKSRKLQAHEDIRYINEYGRRLFPEFITDNRKLFLCPDSIAILRAGEANPIIEDNYWKEFSSQRPEKYAKNPIYLPKIVKKLLSWENKDLFINSDHEKVLNTSTLYIKPALDDRMFVCCCVIDSDYTSSFIENTNYGCQNPKWKFMTNYDTGRELYAVTNIDADTDSSCQNRLMLNQYFEEQLYLRWIEYGTIHAVTNHSMVCLTGDLTYIEDGEEKETGVRQTVVYPFLTLYTQMCALVLAQRASLISFDAKITNAVSDAQTQGVSMDEKCLNKLLELSENFAIFQGEILLAEITPQIQGIELYEKLQRMLFIDKLEKNIQQQLNNLFEIAESIQARLQRKHDEKMKKLQERQEKQAKKFDNALAKFSAVFTAISVISIFSAFTDLRDFLSNFESWNKCVLSVVSVIIVITVALVAGISIWKKMEYWMGKDK